MDNGSMSSAERLTVVLERQMQMAGNRDTKLNGWEAGEKTDV